ncbi:MAG: UbiA family prenyltransferase [Planctomycetota bacterium]
MGFRAAIAHSNLYVAGAAGAVCAASVCDGLGPVPTGAGLISGPWLGPVIGPLLGPTLAAGFGAGCVYTLDRLVGAPSDQDDRSAMFARNRARLWPWAVLLGLGAAAGVVASSTGAQLALAGVAAVSLLYCVPWLPWRGQRLRLAQVPYAKAVLVGLAWAGATAVAPMLAIGRDLGPVAWASLERALFIVALTLPIDLRDLEADRRAGVRTVARGWGEAGVRRVSVAALAGAAAIAGMRHGLVGAWPSWTAYVAAAWVTAAASTKRGPGFFAWAPDAPIWLWAGLMVGRRLLAD